MAALQSSALFLSSPHVPGSRTRCSAIHLSKNLRIGALVEELRSGNGFSSLISPRESSNFHLFTEMDDPSSSSSLVVAKLYAILEAVSDRVEMHKNIGKQREDWNSLLLTSVNAITLTAATVTGIAAATGAVGATLLSLKLSSTLMLLGATGILSMMNRIQPSQLVEEQKSATRLFQQLHCEIHTVLSIGSPSERDVEEAMERVLALDRAYPLPLLGVMLEKFPSGLEPSVWWPQEQRHSNDSDSNGWDMRLEEEMRSVVDVLRRKDREEYVRLGEKALKLNKIFAVAGPSLTAMAAIGAALVGTSSWAAIVGVLGGALACVVNTLEHGGRVGMVFEMYRNNAGFFKLMEESIESNLMDGNRRENGELFEMKVALNLGRSLSELGNLVAADEFGSKLF